MTVRATFRPVSSAGAWQKQLRDRYEAEGIPAVPHLDVRRAVVRSISRHLAAQIILKYEWLGTMAPTSVHYGLFFGRYCAGVCCVGFATGNYHAAMEFRLAQDDLAYLARGAMVHWAPKGSNSKLVAWACRLLTQAMSAKLIIAYADTDAGEIGTIYQACNWIYVGRGEATYQWIAPNGRVLYKKYADGLVRRYGGTYGAWATKLCQAGWTNQKSNPKHRYVYVLDRADTALVARIEHMRHPYPKRAGSIQDAPAVHVGEDSATLIPALSGDAE